MAAARVALRGGAVAIALLRAVGYASLRTPAGVGAVSTRTARSMASAREKRWAAPSSLSPRWAIGRLTKYWEPQRRHVTPATRAFLALGV